MKFRKDRINRTQISYLKEFELNGIKQKVLIEGKSSYNPVLITLHGLGTSMPFTCGSRGLHPHLTSKYTMVYWDQLGTGINNEDISNYKIDDYVQMTVDLVHEVSNLFPNNKIYLFGVSWGSLLALKVVNLTDSVDGVITYGQISKNMYFSEDTFKRFYRTCRRVKVLSSLKELENKEVHTYQDVIELSKHIKKYTPGYLNKKSLQPELLAAVVGNLFSPDYKSKDFKGLFKNGFLKSGNLVDELIHLDVSEDFLNINKPYYIVQGADDLITPTGELVKIIEETNNKNIRLNIIGESSHIPSRNAMDLVFGQLEECLKEGKNI